MKTTVISILLLLTSLALKGGVFIDNDHDVTGPARTAQIDTIVVFVDSVVGTTGANATVSVRTSGFSNLISMQGSILWDTSAIEFIAVQSMNLPSMSAANFGLTQTANGQLTFSWNDPSLSGVASAASAPVFDLNFLVKMTAGNATPVVLSNTPVVFELVDASFTTLHASLINGEIRVPNIQGLVPGSEQLMWTFYPNPMQGQNGAFEGLQPGESYQVTWMALDGRALSTKTIQADLDGHIAVFMDQTLGDGMNVLKISCLNTTASQLVKVYR